MDPVVSRRKRFIPREIHPHALVVTVGVLLVLFGFALGNVLGRQQGLRAAVPEGEGRVVNQGSRGTDLAKDVDFQKFWEVWNLVKAEYYAPPVSDKDLYYGAVRGMVEAAGDPYTTYFPPADAAAFMESLEGSFEGIGAEIGIKDEQLQVIAPLPKTPAERAGLKTGDAILAIDGAGTDGMTVEEAVSRIRGKGGTSVTLTLYTAGEDAPRDVSITRDTIEIASLEYAVEDGIATISVYTFNNDTNRLFGEAVNAVLAEGARGIVLDLRGNPGGLLSAAVNMASAWVGYDTVVIEKGRGGTVPFRGLSAPRLAEIPTVVLVNGGSASASEIVAGALQDYDLATIVGTQTFGKGSVQDYRALDDGAAVKITIATWYTPLDRTINETGITPDRLISYGSEDALAGKDPQKDAALEILNAR